VNGLRRWLTGTRTMRSAAAEFGPPPGARYGHLLVGLTDVEAVRRAHRLIAAQQSPAERAADRVVAARARAERLGASPQRPVRTVAVAW
jgi:hypothetical protein